MPTDLAICIVNWNTRDLLDKCLQSIRDTQGALSVETIVVDNASTDGSAEMVREKHPWARLIANSNNRFYAAGNNQALQAVDAPFKLLLNPDIIVHEGSLQTLLGFMERHPDAGAVAPRLRGVDGEIQPSCRTFPGPDVVRYEALGLSRLFPRDREFGKYRMTWWDYDDEREVDQPMASAFLVRDAALQKIGLFDEQFPMFFNDVDLCRRLWDAGWEVWFTPVAEMTHLGGASTRQVRREMIIESHRSFVRYYEKHYRATLSPLEYSFTLCLLRVGLRMRLGMLDLRRLVGSRSHQ
jgi:GT2 family glycosyltransferase